jgi:NADP-dependent 3-hydroxy acid dehydrogenase YdfG
MHTTWTRRDPFSSLSQSGEARRCNNAGYGLVGVLEELSDEQIARNFDANFFGALQVIRAALPILRAQRCGHIVNISAAAVISNYAGFSIYGASEVGARRRVGIARRRTKAAR